MARDRRAGPLAGKVVLVTRPRDEAGGLADALRDRGAVPIEAPVIQIVPVRAGGPLDEAINSTGVGRFAWIAFTSPNAVEAWFQRAAALGLDVSNFPARVAAVGEATGDALRSHGIVPDLVPREFTTAALGRALPRGRGKVLLPRADIATPELENGLTSKGWTVVRVDAYGTRPLHSLPREARAALRAGRVDALAFTSASTVDGFVRLAGVVRGPRVACIGPVTARAARTAGFKVHAVARPHTIEGLVEGLERALRRPGS
ncbi:MAG TPA: uroporphyrinogen-III synthase [Actinomycetota bacterium]|nr:uroporphyrinogen-III synthase [Actinomycetota bacterium]